MAVDFAPQMTREIKPVIKRDKQTKWKIFVKAVDLFSEYGVEAVSMRTIAAAVGIRAGSIYNHFASKDELVREMYNFYIEHEFRVPFDQEALNRLVETEHPIKVLSMFENTYPEPHERLLSKIIQIAMNRIRSDDEAASALVKRVYDEQIRSALGFALRRMVELGKIKPLDVDSMVEIYKCMCLGASFRMNTDDELGHERWRAMHLLFFRLIEPIEPE